MQYDTFMRANIKKNIQKNPKQTQQAVHIYRRLVSQNYRNVYGKVIMNDFINYGSKCEINISFVCKTNLDSNLISNNGNYSIELFDNAYDEVLRLIENDVWLPFRRTIIELTGDLFWFFFF